MNENNLTHDISINKNKTYFFHVKKSDISNVNDIEAIKKLIKINNNEIDIDINNLKIINKSDLFNISPKNIGKYLKSNKDSICESCKTVIKATNIFKELGCKHRFHTSCIDDKLKNDVYKKCISCKTENVSNNF